MKSIAAVVLAASTAFLALAPVQAQAPRRPPVSVDYGFRAPSAALTQQRLMSDALAALPAQRAGVRDVYILSVALHSDHVFEQEATAGAAALAKHFHAEGRTLVLSNYRGEGATRPVASPDHIQAALARMAEVMDENEDIAVVFLTSHGAQHAGIAGYERVGAGGDTAFRDFMISPGLLRGALDSSGLKNRVVILSACFSGQFIPTLQDTNTAVFTAAIATKPSFGCQPERDWTYFGDAFFDKSLPNAKTLADAFDGARKLIGQWETEQKLDPSQPQMFVGAEMGKLLSQIEK